MRSTCGKCNFAVTPKFCLFYSAVTYPGLPAARVLSQAKSPSQHTDLKVVLVPKTENVLTVGYGFLFLRIYNIQFSPNIKGNKNEVVLTLYLTVDFASSLFHLDAFVIHL